LVEDRPGELGHRDVQVDIGPQRPDAAASRVRRSASPNAPSRRSWSARRRRRRDPPAPGTWATPSTAASDPHAPQVPHHVAAEVAGGGWRQGSSGRRASISRSAARPVAVDGGPTDTGPLGHQLVGDRPARRSSRSPHGLDHAAVRCTRGHAPWGCRRVRRRRSPTQRTARKTETFRLRQVVRQNVADRFGPMPIAAAVLSIVISPPPSRGPGKFSRNPRGRGVTGSASPTPAPDAGALRCSAVSPCCSASCPALGVAGAIGLTPTSSAR
jgi:hypothetical protein